MKQKDLDKIIKDKLNHLEGGDLESPHWDMMEALLQQNGLLDDDIQTFDEAIRSNIPDDYLAGKDAGWLQMASSLDLMDNLDDIESEDVQIFDDVVKSKLQNIPTSTSDWNIFSKKLDAQPEKVLDEITKDKLSHIVDNTQGNWDSLAQKLAYEQSFRKRIIYKYKVLESAVLVLLIFTFINFYPNYKDQLKSLLPDSSTFFSFRTPKETIQKDVAPQKIVPQSNHNIVKQNDDNISENSSLVSESFPNGAQEVAINTAPKKIKISTSNYKKIAGVSVTNQKQITSVKTLDLTKEKDSEKSKPNFFARIFNKKDNETTTQNLKITTPKHLENISLTALEFEKNKRLPNFIDKLKKIPFGITAGMMMVGNYNYISTPADDVLNLNAYKSNGFGYGAGFTMGFQFDKIELQTGIVYKGFKYEPKGREIVGNSKIGVYALRLNEININTIEIPMHIRYQFYNKHDWKLYAGGGATWGLVFQANYFLTSEEFRRPANEELGARSSDLIENSDLHQDKIYRNGAFEGGSVNENQVYTADISFGAEMKLVKKWGIFMEHTYQYALPSNYKSPNNDKINRYNILLGVRRQLR